MPTPKSKQDAAYWDRQWELEKARGKNKGPFLERQKARRLADKLGIDRKGKVVDHKKPLVEGGKTTRSNIRVISAEANRKAAPPRGKAAKKK